MHYARCSCAEAVKNGKMRGKQRYHCQACGCRYTQSSRYLPAAGRSALIKGFSDADNQTTCCLPSAAYFLIIIIENLKMSKNENNFIFLSKDLQGNTTDADEMHEYIRWHLGLEEPPKILYKYREFSNPVYRRLLKEGEIYFSSFDDLNDEKEGKIPLVYIDLLQKPLLTAQETREKFIDKGKYGILSLSKSSSVSTMWQFYSEGKKGFCVGFYTAGLLMSIFGTDISVQEAYSHLLPVRYFSSEERYEKSKSFSFENDFLRLQKIAGTKTDEWEKEREVRLIGRNMASQVLNVPDRDISHILLGKDMDNGNKQKILSILKGRDIRVYEIVDNPESDKDFLYELNLA